MPSGCCCWAPTRARAPRSLDGRADAIQLVGVDFDAGTAVAFGVPRDSWVELEGHGTNRINAGLPFGGPELMASAVEDLFGIAPDYVVTIGTDGPGRISSTVSAASRSTPREITVPSDIDCPRPAWTIRRAATGSGAPRQSGSPGPATTSPAATSTGPRTTRR